MSRRARGVECPETMSGWHVYLPHGRLIRCACGALPPQGQEAARATMKAIARERDLPNLSAEAIEQYQAMRR